MATEASDWVTLVEEFGKELGESMVISCVKEVLRKNGGKTVRFAGSSLVGDGMVGEEGPGS